MYLNLIDLIIINLFEKQGEEKYNEKLGEDISV